jgi:exosortase
VSASGDEKGVETSQPLASHPQLLPGALAIACLLFVFAYRGFLLPEDHLSLQKGVEYWFFRPNQTGAIVVLVLALWLFYRRWPRLSALPPTQASPWLIGSVFAVSFGIFLWAQYTLATELHALSVAGNAVGVLLLLRGVAGLRAAWLPIAFLLFAIPIPAPLLLAVVWKLQILTSEYAGWLLYMLGEPALVSGDQILRASQTFQVIETCSGLQSTQTLTMLTVALVDLFRRRGLHAALLLVSAPPIAFALNGVRVLTLILNPHSELLGVHTLQGVAILLSGLMSVYWLDGLLERFLPTPAAHSRLERAGRSAPVDAKPSRLTLRAVVVLGVSVGTLLASWWAPAWTPSAEPLPQLQASVESASARWQSEEVQRDWMFQGSVRFRDFAHHQIRVQGQPVEIFIGAGNFRRGGGSPLSPSTAFPGAGWHLESSEFETLADGEVVRANHLRKGNRQLLVHHRYGRSLGLPTETLRALLALEQSRFRRARPPYVIRMSTPIAAAAGEAPERARQLADFRLKRVYRELGPILSDL